MRFVQLRGDILLLFDCLACDTEVGRLGEVVDQLVALLPGQIFAVPSDQPRKRFVVLQGVQVPSTKNIASLVASNVWPSSHGSLDLALVSLAIVMSRTIAHMPVGVRCRP